MWPLFKQHTLTVNNFLHLNKCLVVSRSIVTERNKQLRGIVRFWISTFLFHSYSKPNWLPKINKQQKIVFRTEIKLCVCLWMPKLHLQNIWRNAFSHMHKILYYFKHKSGWPYLVPINLSYKKLLGTVYISILQAWFGIQCNISWWQWWRKNSGLFTLRKG